MCGTGAAAVKWPGYDCRREPLVPAAALRQAMPDEMLPRIAAGQLHVVVEREIPIGIELRQAGAAGRIDHRQMHRTTEIGGFLVAAGGDISGERISISKAGSFEPSGV